MSFIGEHGLELHMERKQIARVYEKLQEVDPKLGNWGGTAMNSFRIEKGIPLFGKDFTKDHDAYEVGLDRFGYGSCLGARKRPRRPSPGGPSSTSVSSSPTHTSVASGQDLHSELERLRAENEELRAKNLQMQGETLRSASAEPQITPSYVLDDPFEPPPQKLWMPLSCGALSEFGSTECGSETACSATPVSNARNISFGFGSHCPSSVASGAVTPTQHQHDAQMCHAVMPMWFPVMSMPAGIVDVAVIPNGIVQSARQQFERIAGMK